MENNFWVSQMNTQNGLTIEHIAKFAKLSESIALTPLSDDMNDLVTSKLTDD
jgi:hypothetical protein